MRTFLIAMSIHSDAFAILRDCRALFLKHLGALLQDSQLVSGHAISAIQKGRGRISTKSSPPSGAAISPKKPAA
jgi:hypothetical protein